MRKSASMARPLCTSLYYSTKVDLTIAGWVSCLLCRRHRFRSQSSCEFLWKARRIARADIVSEVAMAFREAAEDWERDLPEEVRVRTGTFEERVALDGQLQDGETALPPARPQQRVYGLLPSHEELGALAADEASDAGPSSSAPPWRPLSDSVNHKLSRPRSSAMAASAPSNSRTPASRRRSSEIMASTPRSSSACSSSAAAARAAPWPPRGSPANRPAAAPPTHPRPRAGRLPWHDPRA